MKVSVAMMEEVKRGGKRREEDEGTMQLHGRAKIVESRDF